MTEAHKEQMLGATDEEEYWQAVQTRDDRFDGSFVYAVHSTGIYCRPSCPARRPGREQVIFFALPEGAERAGFRACRRCLPRETAVRSPHVEMARRACRWIENHVDEALSLSALGTQLGVSPHHMQRMFKRVMGITPRQYAEACRLRRLKARLREGEKVTSALYEAGYSSSSRLYERAPEQLGMTPAGYRRGGKGHYIGYTLVDSPLGRLLVAGTERGICAVSLGDSDAALEAALVKEYPAAEIRRRDEALSAWVRALLSHLSAAQPHLDLPLDLRATAFQWRVWEELRAIPYGSTRTYTQVAQALGQPGAARAVARACATNPAAVVIPCHRVVREDGGLGGYRWGLDRKRALLAREEAEARRK